MEGKNNFQGVAKTWKNLQTYTNPAQFPGNQPL